MCCEILCSCVKKKQRKIKNEQNLLHPACTCQTAPLRDIVSPKLLISCDSKAGELILNVKFRCFLYDPARVLLTSHLAAVPGMGSQFRLRVARLLVFS